LVPFGAFVEVDDAIEGLVHISELADHHVERAEDEVGVHDRVDVKIIDIDLDRRRISLSRKQAMAPTDETGEPVGAPSSSQTVTLEDAGDIDEAAEVSEMELEVEEPATEIPTEVAPEASSEVEEPAADDAPDDVDEKPESDDAGGADDAVAAAGYAAPVSAVPEAAPATDAEEAVGSEEAQAAPSAEGDSIESIVQDMKRERGQ
jgi:small subunit ribosomal protein S1